MLEKLNLKFTYNTEDDDILRDFYIPALSNSVSYDRAVGYFSSHVLVQLSQGLKSLVQSKGRMRLIIGEPLTKDEFKAVCIGNLQKIDELSKSFEALVSDEKVAGSEILTYLIASDRLEVRFSLRRRGMFHQKIGVLRDHNGFVIAFNGSANETVNALEDINSEEISVYPCNHPVFETHGINYVKSFDKLWSNEAKNTRVVKLDSAIYNRIQSKANLPQLREALGVVDSWEDFEVNDVALKYEIPRIPSAINGESFNLREHQNCAIANWKENSHKGILELATGSGKTVTALCALVELYESRTSQKLPTTVIISVPYIPLAKQWLGELKLFNIFPLECFDNQHNWFGNLKRKIKLKQFGEINFLCILVVNKTLKSEVFQGLIRGIDPSEILVVGDECHHHGAESTAEALPLCTHRLGLSATPFISDDDEQESPFPDLAKERLIKYYGGIVAKYTLKDAIIDGVLTPYDYHIIPVYLSAFEQENYDSLSKSISQLVIIANKRRLTNQETLNFQILCGKRNKLMGVAENKLTALRTILENKYGNSRKGTLFYVGEGRDSSEQNDYISLVTEELYRQGWSVAKFTSKESMKERKNILSAFRSNDLEALVAMKVLDEGIDIPACETAFILASTKKPKAVHSTKRSSFKKKSRKNKGKYL